MRTTLLLGLVAVASAFTSKPVFSSCKTLRMSSTDTLSSASTSPQDVPIVITGKNIELTQAMVDYVKKKIGGPLSKLSSNGAIRECDVHLSVSKNPKVKSGHRVEITTNMKGTTFHAKTESPDMYESVDSAAHALYRKLCRYKERKLQGWHGGDSLADDILEALQDLEEEQLEQTDKSEEDFLDPEAPVITKIKSYDLTKPISLKEAVFALDYIDHDFYVFRNEETDEINVVYKRNVGGVGLVQP